MTEQSTRISLPGITPETFGALGRLAGTVDEQAAGAGLDAAVLELARVRSSQINGCAYCLDLHTRAAAAHGETRQRLDALSGWRSSTLFGERERAALALAESVTLLADAGVPDDVYRAAAAEFDDTQLALLLWAVALVNTYNRLAVATAPGR